MTVTVDAPPASSSTATDSTPSMTLSSSVTLDTQWPQVIPVTDSSVVIGMGFSLGCGLGTDEAGDGSGRLGDLLFGNGTALLRGFGDAVAQVVVKQLQRDGFEGLRRGRDLGEDVDAVDVFVDHPLNAAHLAFCPAQALEQFVLIVDVT